MLHERVPNLAKFVEPDRVRRGWYTDAAFFEMEMERIHERVWTTAATRRRCEGGRLLHDADPAASRCSWCAARTQSKRALQSLPHRGSMMCGDRSGNAASSSAAPTIPGLSTTTASCAHPDDGVRLRRTR